MQLDEALSRSQSLWLGDGPVGLDRDAAIALNEGDLLGLGDGVLRHVGCVVRW
jgi:hypothetical protein